MFDEEIKITNEPPKEPRKPPALLIFGIAMIGGAVLVALGKRLLNLVRILRSQIFRQVVQ